jgi:hypothetical protein
MSELLLFAITYSLATAYLNASASNPTLQLKSLSEMITDSIRNNPEQYARAIWRNNAFLQKNIDNGV